MKPSNKKVLGIKIAQPKSPTSFKLDRLENPHRDKTYNIRLTVPEFTSICPVTGQPDFALIIIDYIPVLWMVESKSFKLYMNSFRNHGVFHEDVTLTIASLLKKELKPKWIRIASYFAPRGGIPIDVFWQSGNPPSSAFIPKNDNYKLLNR